MKKITAISLAALASAWAFTGCNSSTYIEAENTSSSVAVYSFSIQADKNIMAGLDSVFFSIDLEKGVIFNADSLPYGTKVTKLIPVIQVVDDVSALTVTEKRANGTDSVHDYLKNTSDSIDFTHPVVLTLTSPSGAVKREYTVTLNVHKLVSDSLQWGRTARKVLPSVFGVPTRQRTVRTNDAFWCLSTAAGQWSLATAADPSTNWDKYKVDMPAGSDIETFAAAGDRLHIIANGILHYSTDGGRSWTSSGSSWHSCYGAYGNELLGTAIINGVYKVVSYPGNYPIVDVPEGMPVEGTSVAATVKFPLSTSEQMYFTGGVDADGRYCADTWAFDGKAWAKISQKPLPKGLADAVMVPYYTFRTSQLNVKQYDAILVFGGYDGKAVNRTVYVSSDYGVTWNEGGSLVQLPDYLPSVTSAQAYVYSETLHARSDEGWLEFGSGLSRATKPVEQWQCPYIYMFGGYDASGYLQPYVWRGVINRLSYKPVI